MRRSRAFIVAAAMVTLAIGAIAAPAAAIVPRLAIVNGIPGRTVDVCVGTDEVASRLRYGKAAQRTVSPGSPTIRFRAASPGKCKGSVLAAEPLVIAGNTDLTIVGTKRGPKVVVFDNVPLPASTNAFIVLRYAGDLGDVNVIELLSLFVGPTATPPPFEKGDQRAFLAGVPFAARYSLFLDGKTQPFRETGWVSTNTGQRTDVILVGSSTRNDKLVIVRRPIP